MEELLRHIFSQIKNQGGSEFRIDIPAREIQFKKEGVEYILTITKMSEISPVPKVTWEKDVEKLNLQEARRIIRALWRLSDDRQVDKTDIKTALEIVLEERERGTGEIKEDDRDRNRTD